MTRILFVSLESSIGGAETSLLLMIKHLRSRFDLSVACPAGGSLSKVLCSMQVDCYRLPTPPRRSYLSLLSLIYLLKTNGYLIRIAKKANPDLIHANCFYAGAASILAVHVTRKKLVLHARDFTSFGFLAKFLSRFCKKVIAISHAVESTLVKQGVSADKIRVVYNGIDNSFYEQTKQSADMLSTPGPHKNHSFVFANVGQFVPWKKHICFLEAASRIAPSLPNARFMFVGDDIFGRDCDYKNSLLSYARNSSIAERVDFLGWQEDMDVVWPKINCLVHTADREPFGRVIIESMAHNVPVIAVDSCGPSEIIQNGKTGILVKAGDIEGLSDAMLKIAQDTYLAKKLTTTGYEHAFSNFTAEKTAAQIQEIYKEVLAL
ncbi:MAG: glycosyltransferase family 4 protein [Planctomycetota bacterium]|nr:glycosyltransferase family 4 protein [Planctomycetota bacterium]